MTNERALQLRIDEARALTSTRKEGGMADRTMYEVEFRYPGDPWDHVAWCDTEEEATAMATDPMTLDPEYGMEQRVVRWTGTVCWTAEPLATDPNAEEAGS